MSTTPKKIRSYETLTERIHNISKTIKGMEVHLLGRIRSVEKNFPFWMLETEPGRDKREICLSGGIHGNEPAGVESILGFMEDLAEDDSLLEKYHFTFFPCINPFGYEHHTRENDSKIDLNRQFKRKNPALEVRLVKDIFSQRNFDLNYEFHEDVDTHGFYLYELCHEHQEIGEKIINIIERLCSINKDEVIEEMGAKNGVISLSTLGPDLYDRLDKRGGWPQGVYTSKQGTPVCITAETPARLEMAERVKIHLAALKAALALL